MREVHYLTQDALDKMKDELVDMKTNGRAAVAKAIAEAREKGDLKENAEYAAAKEAQGLLEAKIAKLEGTIATANVVDPSAIDTSKVSVLTSVRVFNCKTQKEAVYHLVSESEADMRSAKISVNSPIGSQLLGATTGQTVQVQTPGGVVDFIIRDIFVPS